MQGGTKILGKIYQKAIGMIDPTQGDAGKGKKEEALPSNLGKDKEIDALLQECEALRAEAMLHLEAQYQLANVALALLGGLAIAAALLFGLNGGQVLHLTTPNLYFFLLFLVLVVSALFTSLFHAFLSHQHDLGLIGVYIYHVTRVRLRELLKIEKDDSQFFSWDYFHQQQLTSRGKLSWLVSAVLTTAHLGVEGILALLTLVMAFGIYVANSSLFMGNGWIWVAVGFFIFDALYLLASIPVGMETVGLFKQISKVDISSLHM